MSKATRTANRQARNVIRFTRRTWNPAQVAAWAGDSRPLTAASEARFALIHPLVVGGEVDCWRLRRALRAAEVKG